MPNRILRDWTDSFTIDSLDVNVERFFTRLIMKVDDYGRLYSDTRLLKASLFPLKTDIRETDISRWITACEKAGLIVTYIVANKGYLQISDFKQQLRQKNEKYPSPDQCEADDMHTHSRCIADDNTKGNESETEVEKNKKGEFVPPSLDDVKNYFLEKGYSEVSAIRAFNYYEEGSWKDSKGNKVKNWKQKMQGVWFKDENRTKMPPNVKRSGILRKALKIWPNCIVDCEGGFNYEAKLADVQMFNNGKLDLSHFDREF